MRKIICWIKAIPFYLRCGVWCPHVYREESREKTIIISTDNGFRVSKDFVHKPNEKVHPNATLVIDKCKYCGIEHKSWINGSVPVIYTD